MKLRSIEGTHDTSGGRWEMTAFPCRYAFSRFLPHHSNLSGGSSVRMTFLGHLGTLCWERRAQKRRAAKHETSTDWINQHHYRNRSFHCHSGLCDTAPLQTSSAPPAPWADDSLSGGVHTEACAVIMSVPFQQQRESRLGNVPADSDVHTVEWSPRYRSRLPDDTYRHA